MKLEVLKKLQLLERYYRERLENMEEVEGYTKGEMLSYYLSNARYIISVLEKLGVEYTIEDKEGWGKIFVFNLGEDKLFTNSHKYGVLDVYYYSKSYTCIPCESIL